MQSLGWRTTRADDADPFPLTDRPVLEVLGLVRAEATQRQDVREDA
ncbi:hypothetical protein SNL152K_513 [Streptomyces sp. NL15-2K]|nr:hypothetical protein SNL152K_513 [Streptomyces sp. NL15-2K]